MRTVVDIYEEYRIPPWLQMHQLRVAAVGKMVSGARPEADGDLVVQTCLVHDMGATVKFDFGAAMHSGEQGLCPVGELPHWLEVQREMRARYGEKEHVATEAIITELGLTEVRRVFGGMGFHHLREILDTGFLEAQIAQYGDMRVGVWGVVPLKERMTEVLARYADHFAREGRAGEVATYLPSAEEIERRLFAGVALKPEDITDASVAPIIEELKKYPIS